MPPASRSPHDYQAALLALSCPALIAGADQVIVAANAAMAALLGIAQADATGRPLNQFFEAQALERGVALALQGHAETLPQALVPQIGSHALCSASWAAVPGSGQGKTARVVMVLAPPGPEAQRLAELRYAQSVAGIGTLHLDRVRDEVTLSPEAAHIIDWPSQHPMPAREWMQRVHPDDRNIVVHAWQQARAGRPYRIEYRLQVRNRIKWVEVRGEAQRDSEGQITQAFGTILDITNHKQVANHLEKLAYFDVLTGLPNQMHGLALFQQQLARSQQAQQPLAVLSLTPSRLDDVRDLHGHGTSDEVLRLVAQRLATLQNDDTTVARVSGDVFMTVARVADAEGASRLARQVQALMQEPVSFGGQAFHIGMHIGCAQSPDDARAIDELRRCADIAMQRATRQGDYAIERYTAAMGQELSRLIQMAQRLEKALANGALQQYYQPRFDLHTRELIGAEALARWHDPEWGWVSPAEFIPLAEERGLVVEVGDWALRTAARQVQAWQAQGLQLAGRVSVNVAAPQLVEPGFAQHARQLVEQHGATTQQIELEITETALVADPAQAQRVARQLTDEGFLLALDDFGTGYSSLSQLRHFPVSILKVDMSFVRRLGLSREDDAIVAAIVHMAKALGLRCVSEGVEQEAQASQLLAMGCEEVQGYLLGRPVPAEEFAQRWLQKG